MNLIVSFADKEFKLRAKYKKKGAKPKSKCFVLSKSKNALCLSKSNETTIFLEEKLCVISALLLKKLRVKKLFCFVSLSSLRERKLKDKF
jgi:hypothetical protein